MKTCGVLLAAGASRRLGRPKQLEPIEGEPLVRRAASALASACDEVVVVVGAHEQRIREELVHVSVQIASNPEWREGVASSIRAGMAAIGEVDAVLLAVCDQLRFDREVAAGLVSRHDGQPERVVASAYSGIHGVPALFGKAWFPALARLTGDRGARDLIPDRGDPRLVSVPWPEGGIDLDLP